MIVVASVNGRVGMEAAWRVLERGGSALDAVEAGTREVESNPDDHSVGYGGYPNFDGVVELDASIIDGTTRRTGAVAALRGYRHAVTVARAVMEQLPHVLVAGDGAARLAAAIGLEPEDLLTEDAARIWQEGLAGRRPASIFTAVLESVRALATDPKHVAGTVDFIARDGGGHLASAVSTSGWAWKFPGRVGDSPIVGAGNACDDRYGAVGCTGHGELAIRAGTAGTVLRALARGAPVAVALTEAVHDVYDLVAPDAGAPPIMSIAALDAAERHHAVTTVGEATYLVWQDGMPEAQELPREIVPRP